MEALNEFVDSLNQLSLDPRKAWMESVRAICERELAVAALPPKLAEAIARSRLRILTANLNSALAGGHYDLGATAIAEFASSLRTAVLYERQHGALRPITPDSEVKRVAATLTAYQYNALELDALRVMLAPGERVQDVGWWAIKTGDRSISRSELRAFLRPATWRRDDTWAQQFIGDSTLKQMEAEASSQ